MPSIGTPFPNRPLRAPWAIATTAVIVAATIVTVTTVTAVHRYLSVFVMARLARDFTAILLTIDIRITDQIIGLTRIRIIGRAIAVRFTVIGPIPTHLADRMVTRRTPMPALDPTLITNPRRFITNRLPCIRNSRMPFSPTAFTTAGTVTVARTVFNTSLASLSLAGIL